MSLRESMDQRLSTKKKKVYSLMGFYCVLKRLVENFFLGGAGLVVVAEAIETAANKKISPVVPTHFFLYLKVKKKK